METGITAEDTILEPAVSQVETTVKSQADCTESTEECHTSASTSDETIMTSRFLPVDDNDQSPTTTTEIDPQLDDDHVAVTTPISTSVIESTDDVTHNSFSKDDSSAERNMTSRATDKFAGMDRSDVEMEDDVTDSAADNSKELHVARKANNRKMSAKKRTFSFTGRLYYLIVGNFHNVDGCCRRPMTPPVRNRCMQRIGLILNKMLSIYLRKL